MWVKVRPQNNVRHFVDDSFQMQEKIAYWFNIEQFVPEGPFEDSSQLWSGPE